MYAEQAEFPMVKESPKARAFRQFHAANPWVMHALRELALNLRRKGIKRWSINGLFEVLRWRRALETTGIRFKLDNNLRAYYARELMKEPQLYLFFAIRDSEADDG